MLNWFRLSFRGIDLRHIASRIRKVGGWLRRHLSVRVDTQRLRAMIDVLISELLVITRHLEAGRGPNEDKNRRPGGSENRRGRA